MWSMTPIRTWLIWRLLYEITNYFFDPGSDRDQACSDGDTKAELG